MPKDKQKVAAPVEELPLEKTNTIPNSRLSGLENKVVRLIPHDDDRRISGNEIAQMLGIDRRKITTIIASLKRRAYYRGSKYQQLRILHSTNGSC